MALKVQENPATHHWHGIPTPVDALYVHVPFCFHKCHYCDFYSLVDGPSGAGSDRQAAFSAALIAELWRRSAFWVPRPPFGGSADNSADQRGTEPNSGQTLAPPGYPCQTRCGVGPHSQRTQQATTAPNCRLRTIFVGGGTPTLLRPQLWQRFLAAMRQSGALEQATEFTVEANPETVTDELMAVLAAGGVNRVSVGVQTFQSDLLKMLERWHDPSHVQQAVRRIRDSGVRNLNLDLIFAIPGQTMAQLDADLDAALALDPQHLSCYGLTYEPNTPMTVRLRIGSFERVPEEVERTMYERVLDRLADAGFEHYEVSNWARRDPSGVSSTAPSPHRCRHNLAYWRNLNWLGIGPAAASHVDGHRWKNEPHLGRYIKGAPSPPVVDTEHLNAERRIGEHLMLALRMMDGIEWSWLEANLAQSDERWRTIEGFLDAKLLERHDGHLRLTRAGLFVADGVVERLL